MFSLYMLVSFASWFLRVVIRVFAGIARIAFLFLCGLFGCMKGIVRAIARFCARQREGSGLENGNNHRVFG